VESPAAHIVSAHMMSAAQFTSVKHASQQLCCRQLWQDAFVVTVWPEHASAAEPGLAPSATGAAASDWETAVPPSARTDPPPPGDPPPPESAAVPQDASFIATQSPSAGGWLGACDEHPPPAKVADVKLSRTMNVATLDLMDLTIVRVYFRSSFSDAELMQ
jgi:hypothetical protein